jgi:Na+-translocating ferredoxin:NAD+ oxidoreductase RNF subunit RnfB/Fe-S cluster biogenesis protein NfuA
MQVDQRGAEERAASSASPAYPRLRRALCLRARCGPEYCTACREACPQDALTFAPDDSLPRLHKLFCTSCGQCAATCPVEAWNLVLVEPSPSIPDATGKGRDPQPNGGESSLRDVEVSCRRAQTAPQDDSVEAEDSAQSSGPTRVIIPCILGISGGQVTAWQASAETTVWLHMGECSSCPNGRQHEQRQRPYLLATLIPGVEVRVDTTAPTAGPDSAEANPSWAEARVSRKLLLGTATAALAGAFLARVPLGRSENPLTQEGDDSMPWAREVFIARLIRHGTLKSLDAHLVGLGSLTTTDGGVCDGCGLCLRSCPTEALTFKDTALELLPECCVGCGVCIARCPHGVLAHAEQVDLATIGQPVTLTPIPSARCPCGAPALSHTLPKRPRCQNCTRAESLLHDLTAPTRDQQAVEE